MRKYENQENSMLREVYCNCCGKKIKVENGMIMEGVLPVDIQWGYFSDKDTEHHQFDLCEACYDKMIGKFKIPVQTEIEKELL